MHAALEKVADRKGLTGERRDAFIYGAMRKAGWKPKREVDKSAKRERRLSAIPTMNTRLDRLITLNARTNDLLEFKKLWDPETEQWVDDGTGNTVANAVVGAGVLGAGGYAGHRAISNAGGYGAVASAARSKIAPVVAAVGPKAATAATSTATKVASLLAKLKKVRFESREERLVHLNSRADEVIEFDGVGRFAGVLAASLAGGQVGHALGKKKWDPALGRWVDSEGHRSRVNLAVETGTLAGGLGAVGAIHGAPTIKRKGAAIGTAVRKTVSRAGKIDLRRAATGAVKAARYA